MPGTSIDISALQALALQEAQTGKVNEAMRDYLHVLAVQPDWKDGWWNLGTLQYSANQFADAKSTFKKVVTFAPSMGTAWSLLGLTEFETKDYFDAKLHLEKAHLLGIDDEEIKRVSIYHLGMLLNREGGFEQAQDLLLANFGGDVISPQVKFLLGLTLLRVPLLPDEIDPSKEALVNAAGTVASASETALNLFPALLATYPDTPYIHYAYGLALDHAGRHQEALAQIRAETLISPGSSLPWLEINRLASRVGDVQEARAATTTATAIAAGQSNPEARIIQLYSVTTPNAQSKETVETAPDIWNRAMREYARGEFTSAIVDLKICVKSQPQNGTGWAVLGLSEFALKDYENALIHLDRGRSLGFKGSADAIRTATYTLGILLIHSGEFDRAAELLASFLKVTREDKEVQYALGLSLLRKKEFPEPENQECKLIEIAGKIAALLEDSRYDEAFPLFEGLLQQYPSEPFLHYAYGTALLALSEFDQAELQMRREISASPTSELPYIGLASIYLREHLPAAAIPVAKRALSLSPRSAEAHYLLGRSALEAGDDIVAVHELETASRLSSGSLEVHFNLAKAYTRAKMTDAAARERAIFARLNELSENEKKQGANQSYSGPRDANRMIQPPSPDAQIGSQP